MQYNIINRGELIYHYTSLDVFLKIMEGSDNRNIKFHASGLQCMNDSSEFIYGFKQFRRLLPYIEGKIGDIPHEQKLSTMIETADEYFSRHWDEKYTNILLQSHQTPFVISTSAHGNSIPMWEMYGDGGRGVAIGLDIDVPKEKIDGVIHMDWTKLSETIHAFKIVQQPSLQHPAFSLAISKYREYLEKITKTDKHLLNDLKLETLYNLCVLCSTLVKHPAFMYEKEWRILAFPNSNKEIHYKVNSKGRLVPYIVVNIPVSQMKKIIVGPCYQDAHIKKMIEHLLLKKEIPNSKVMVSKLPYRG